MVAMPLLGALICVPLTSRLARPVALAVSVIGIFFAGMLWCQFNSNDASSLQMGISLPWLTQYGIHWSLGIDGLSFPLILLTKLMIPIAILSGWNEERHSRAFMICYLVLDSAMTGTFLATDIFLFYVFWEMMLIPMLLLIGVWGSQERIYACLKFFLYTFAGSILMLAAILFIFHQYHAQFGQYSADIATLKQVVLPSSSILWSMSVEDLVFWGFTLAFLIKVPLFPFHTWLPDAHVQAPTGGSVLLAAVLLKMGTYGLLRFSIPFAPTAFMDSVPLLATLSLVGIIYGAWVAFQQTDFKKLIAYSSVSHLAFVVLGISAMNVEGLTGSVLQMINHGIITGALFLLVGMLYERRHTRAFSDFGGIAGVLPWYSFFLVFVACASMGVPGLSGFVGEFMILVGTFQTRPAWAFIASLGVIFGAAYTLIMLKQVLFGPITKSENRKLIDLNFREWCALVPLVALMIGLGVYPRVFLKRFDQYLNSYWSTTLRQLPPKLSEPSDVIQRTGKGST